MNKGNLMRTGLEAELTKRGVKDKHLDIFVDNIAAKLNTDGDDLTVGDQTLTEYLDQKIGAVNGDDNANDNQENQVLRPTGWNYPSMQDQNKAG